MTSPLARYIVAIGLCLALPLSAHGQSGPCARSDGASSRDVRWQHEQPSHPLVGRVFKDGRPLSVTEGTCTPTPLQQLIAELWDVIRGGGIVLLGEVHDNPEQHVVRGDILWPRLGNLVPTRGLRPAAVFEHIRATQQPQIDSFYLKAARSRRLWRASDLLRELKWDASGWPDGEIFQPLFDAALWAKLRVYPGNGPRDRMRPLVRGDHAGITDEEAARLRMAQTMSEPLLAALAAELEASHCGVLPASAFGPMSLAQRYTDAYMAESLAKAAQKHGGAFLLAGNGHVRTDRGVPWHLRQIAPDRKAVAVMLLEVEAGKDDPAADVPRAPDGAWAADYVLFTPAHPRPDPCEKMRQGKR
jgi:uncharacterized iron-regulated protein